MCLRINTLAIPFQNPAVLAQETCYLCGLSSVCQLRNWDSGHPKGVVEPRSHLEKCELPHTALTIPTCISIWPYHNPPLKSHTWWRCPAQGTLSDSPATNTSNYLKSSLASRNWSCANCIKPACCRIRLYITCKETRINYLLKMP